MWIGPEMVSPATFPANVNVMVSPVPRSDFDDVVTRIVSGTGGVGPGVFDVLAVTLPPAERLGHAPEAAPEAPRLTANPGRAPPSS